MSSYTLTRSNIREWDREVVGLEDLLSEIYEEVPFSLIPSMTELSSRVLLRRGDDTESAQQALLNAVTRVARDSEWMMATAGFIGHSRTKVTALATRDGGTQGLVRDFNEFVKPVLAEAITGVGILFERVLEGSLSRGGYEVKSLAEWDSRQSKLGRSIDVLVWLNDRPAIAIECKNHRAATASRLTANEQRRLQAITALGMIPVYVVPASTVRFRRKVDEHGGVVVDTRAFVVGGDSLARRLREVSTPWPVRTVDGSTGNLHLPRAEEDAVLRSIGVVA